MHCQGRGEGNDADYGERNESFGPGSAAEKQPPDENEDTADQSPEHSESNGTRYHQRYHESHDPL